MQRLKTLVVGAAVLLFLAAAVSSRVAVSRSARNHTAAQARAAKPTGTQTRVARPPTGQANVATNEETQCVPDPETFPCGGEIPCPSSPTEAPTGLDNAPNDLVDQATHDDDRAAFEIRDEILPSAIQEGGLGPVYNAQACAECHQNPISGGISQITELRAGHIVLSPTPPSFEDAPGGSLIQHRAVDPQIQERVPPVFSAGFAAEDVTTKRTSLNTLGDGFVEAISNSTLLAIAAAQPDDEVSGHLVAGEAVGVLVEESDPEAEVRCRVGRFGHKDQHASLLSFSGDAYLNEQGITNRLFLEENTSLGRDVSAFDSIPDDATIDCDPSPSPAPPGQNDKCGEDPERDIDAFTQFMRATKAPARDPNLDLPLEGDRSGEEIFHAVGCAVCHVDTIVTAPAGTVINAGTFVVPEALGNRIIHPFGDFLLHDIGTGDGIVQNGGASTRLKVRTAPLWGVRTRTLLMHDAASLTFMDAILRHAGEAEVVRQNFEGLSTAEQQQLIIFLESL